MTEDEKFVREHWTVQRVGEGFAWIVLENVQVGYADWADAASFVRQRLEEIRRAQTVVKLLDEFAIYTNSIVEGNALDMILAREQKRLTSLRRGMKEPQP